MAFKYLDDGLKTVEGDHILGCVIKGNLLYHIIPAQNVGRDDGDEGITAIHDELYMGLLAQ